MKGVPVRCASFLLISIAAIGCAAPHVGTWEHSDERIYRRLMLSEDGTCTIVAGSKIRQLLDGIGARCNYSRAGDFISITSMGEIDGTGPMETLPQPIRLKLESGHLIALDGDREILVRVPK